MRCVGRPGPHAKDAKGVGALGKVLIFGFAVWGGGGKVLSIGCAVWGRTARGG